jgi:hypothetical protein
VNSDSLRRMIWSVAVTVIVLLVASRLGRPFGAAGIVVSVVLAMLTFQVLQLLGRRAAATPAPAPAPRDVTPPEPAVAAPIAARPGTPPTVIVMEPTRSADELGARLAALDRLRADGQLSEHEYEAKRATLIAEL